MSYSQELEKILGNADETGNKYFTIDDATRKITPPNNFKYLGVESDSNANRIWFECPRYVGDNIDLTELNVYINYQNANGDKDRWYAEDVTVEGDKIHFSWKLSRKVLEYKGTVKFIVCAIETDADGEKDPEWNTTLCEGTVLEGLEVENPEPDTPEYDIVNELISLWKEFRPADYNQDDPTKPDYIKNRPFYIYDKTVAEHSITNYYTDSYYIAFNEEADVKDGDTIFVEVTNNGITEKESFTINEDGTDIEYLFGNEISVALGPISYDATQFTCTFGIPSKCGTPIKYSLDLEEARELHGSSVHIMNPTPQPGEVKSVTATVCGVAAEDEVIYFDEATLPAEMPFDTSDGCCIMNDTKYYINGCAIRHLTSEGFGIAHQIFPDGVSIKVYKKAVKTLDEIFIPDGIKHVNPDFAQYDETKKDFVKNRPFYYNWYILAEQEASADSITNELTFDKNIALEDGDTIFVGVTNNGTTEKERFIINEDSVDIAYLFGNETSVNLGSISYNVPQLPCYIGSPSKCGTVIKHYLDLEDTRELFGKTVYILNPLYVEGDFQYVTATICGVAPEDLMIYFDEASLPAEMPFDTSDGCRIISDVRCWINGFVINAWSSDDLEIVRISNYESGSKIKVYKEVIKQADEALIPDTIARKRDLDALFGRCIVTEILSGLTSGMNISLEYPLTFSTWSVWLADTKISGDLKPEETFVSASELFGSEDITVRITTEKFVVVTTARFVNRHEKASWGTLQYVEIENI